MMASGLNTLSTGKGLSQAQQELWLGHTFNENKALFNTAECIVFSGRVDAQALRAAVEQTIRECECVSCFFVNEPPLDNNNTRITHENVKAVRIPTQTSVPFNIITFDQVLNQTKGRGDKNFSAAKTSCNELDILREWARQEIARPFLLESELPCRFTLLRGEHQDYLYQCAHHIALDGFGTTLVFQRIAQIYTSLVAQTPVAKSAFTPFERVLEEEQLRKTSGASDKAKQFWHDALREMATPSTYSQHVSPISSQFHRVSAVFDSDDWQAMVAYSQQHNITWADLFLAVLAAHLALHTNEKVVVLGSMVMNRLGSKSLNVPCMQMNMIPLVIELDDEDTLLACAERIARLKKQVRRHQHYRYEMLRRDRLREQGSPRLFGTLVNIMPFDTPLQYGELAAETVNLSAGPVEDLTIGFHCKAGTLPKLDFDANPDSYQLETVEQLQQELLVLLHQWICEPSLPLKKLLSCQHAKERQCALIFETSNAAAASTADDDPFSLASKSKPTVLSQIAAQAQYSPNKIALQSIGESSSLTYQALWQHVNWVAQRLTYFGVERGSRVAVMMPRSQDAIVLQLAVMLAQGVYTPIDPLLPRARVKALLAEVKIHFVIASEEHAIERDFATRILTIHDLFMESDEGCAVRATFSSELQERVAQPDPAYMMFTSGSTGTPKAIEVSQLALAHFCDAAAKRYRMSPCDRVLQFAPLHFDASVEEVFVTLTQGATLVLRNDAMLQSMSVFSQAVEVAAITVLDLPTAFWNEWVVALDAEMAFIPRALRSVIIGGEALYPQRLAQWQSAVLRRMNTDDIALFNTYGPTETTVVACCAELQHYSTGSMTTEAASVNGDSNEQSALPIGLPLAGVSALVLDAANRPATEGELVILGPTLANGYVNSTNTASVTPQAFDELHIGERCERIYRTGDRVRYDAGQLLYLGRIDNEFKLSGYRIQPSEIEAHLEALPQVRHACVQGIDSGNGLRRLVAFIVPQSASCDWRDIKAQLARRLPIAMVPTDYRFVPELIKTANNKVDRKHLLALYHQSNEPQQPRTELELLVEEIWQQVLGVTSVNIDDNFFELGGQSLHTIQIVNRLTGVLGVTVKVSDVFDHPTLRLLCQYIETIQVPCDDDIEMVW